MESRFFHIFLAFYALIFLSFGSFAAEDPVLDTEYTSKQFKKPDIDVNDFEFFSAVGLLSIEDFGVGTATNIGINYYINESFFVQLAAISATASKTSYEVLTGNASLLTDKERQLNLYHMDIAYNLLSGEGFFSQNHTFSTDYYVIAGVGSTNFAGNDRYSYNYGLGFKAAISSWLTAYSELRNYSFDMDVFGSQKSTNNLSIAIGLGIVF